jgi:NADH-quinone oxidoreductase subunit E
VAKAAAEADAKKAEATPAAVEAKPASETAAAGRPKPSAPAQPSGAANDTPAAHGKVDARSAAEAAKPAGGGKPTPAAPGVAETKPELLTAARNNAPDDLSLIWGVGPKLATMLNEMGVWHFDQIANWKAEELAWVDARLTGFKGRASRDDWVSQAKKLATGWRPDSALGDKPVK